MARYRAKPVEVEAFQITHISHHLLGKHTITLDNGDSAELTAGAINKDDSPLAIGDYYIIANIGAFSRYVCPKAIFEAKYDLVGPPAETSVSQLGLISAAQEKIRNDASEVAPDDGVNVIVPGDVLTGPEPDGQPPVDSGAEVAPAAALEAEPATDEEQAALDATNAGLVSSDVEQGTVVGGEELSVEANELSTDDGLEDEIAHTN